MEESDIARAVRLSFPLTTTIVLFITVYVDIEGNRSRLVYYCLYYGAHS